MSNPVLIVAGAGEGIGAATARRFAAAGYDIGLIARNADSVSALASTLEAEGAQVGWAAADVTGDEALAGALQRMTEHTGRVDVLLYNVSIWRPASSLEITAPELLADLHAGTAGLLTAVQAILPVLRQQRTGTVLATGSAAADRPAKGAASLGVQKAALRALVQSLAVDLEPEGVHASTVTIHGAVRPGTPFAPEAIAELYWDLVQETSGDPGAWRTVIDLRA